MVIKRLRQSRRQRSVAVSTTIVENKQRVIPCEAASCKNNAPELRATRIVGIQVIPVDIKRNI